MRRGFWEKLRKPFFVLAPMADVTDAAFRRIIAKYGKPSVMWTEFVSADGLFLADERGREKLKRDLFFTEEERPIVAQFFTARPDMMERAAASAAALGFDGVDINMGCPDRSVEKQGAGAALMRNPKLAQELIEAAARGAGELPVSVKTRIGYGRNEIEEWLPALLEAEPAAVTLHARTRKEMSKVSADWDAVHRAVHIRGQLGSDTFIVGNGDVKDLDDAGKKAEHAGCDGVMLGRAIFGNPWLFAAPPTFQHSAECWNVGAGHKQYKPKVEERLRVLVEHTKLFEELLGDVKNFSVMKKHYKAYVTGFDGARGLRMRLMGRESAREVEQTIELYLRDGQYTGKTIVA